MQHLGHLLHAVDRLEALFQEELEELVAVPAVRARAGDGAGRLDDQGRVQLVVDQDEAAGDAEDGLFGDDPLRFALLAAGDAADGALELLLGDLDDLRGDAAGVCEGEHGGLVADEQHGAGALLLGVAGVRQEVQS